MWSGERLTKIQTTTRPDHIWPEAWTKIGEVAQHREKQEWAKKKKPKLDHARRLSGIYLIDPDDEEYKEILKNARRKLERLMALAVPCKRPPESIRETCVGQVTAKPNSASEKNSKTVFSCVVESHETTRQRTEPSVQKP